MRIRSLYVRVRALVLAVTVLAVTATPAAATITSVIPANQEGPNDSFFTNEILYATGVNNALQGAAQLCVVAATVTSGSCEEEGSWGRPNAIATHGTFPPQPIVAPMLPVGTYRILADNGDTEDQPADVVSDQFTVIPCPEGDECSTTIADQQMEAWKAAADGARQGFAAACLTATAFSSGAASMIGSALLGAGVRGAIMAEIKGQGVGLEFRPAESQEASFALMRNVACGALLMYDDIVADPPDPDYEHLTEPAPRALHYGLAADGDVQAAARAIEATRAHGVANRVGIERYQGARAANDPAWAAIHAGLAGEQALETQSQMRRLGRTLRTAAAKVADPGITPATSEELAAARAVRERVRLSGFTAEEWADLEAEGLTEAEIAQVREQLGTPLPENVTPTTLDAALHLAADSVDTATCVDESDSCGFDEMGRFASAAGANGTMPPTVTVSPLEIREGDYGVNHGRLLIELSHPFTGLTVYGGLLELTLGTAAEGEIALPRTDWSMERGQTRTYRNVTTTNDLADEAAETATVSATMTGAEPAAPATVTVLDDDGPGDPVTRPRAERGIIALLGGSAGSGTLHLSEPDGTELTQLSDDPFSMQWIPDWSSDGRWLMIQTIAPTASAYAAGGEPVSIQRVGEDGALVGEPRPLLPGLPGSPVQPSFSADGRRLLMARYFGGADYRLSVVTFDPVTGTAGTSHVTGSDPPLDGWWSGHGATFSPDRTRIAFSGCSPGFARCGLWSVPVDDAGAATGPPVAIRELPANRVYWPAWSPDGRLVAYTELDDDGEMGVRTQRVTAEGAAIGSPRWVLEDTLYWIPTPPSWAPDSRSLVIGLPTDPMLPANEGGSSMVVDVDGDGARVGAARNIALATWASQPVWGVLPDETPPQTTLATDPAPAADGIHRAAVKVSLTAVDNRRVTALEYAVDGTATTVQADRASFILDRSGTYVVRYRSRDAAGNLEPQRERTIRIEIPAPVVPPDPVSGPPPADPPAVVTPAPAVVATLPSNRRCVSRRKFRIRLREVKDDPLVRAEVFVNGKRVRVVRGARLTAAIDLRGLPKGKVAVRVTGTTRSGQRVTSKRTYRTCVPKRRG